MRKGLLFILLFAFVAMAQTTVKYRIRMPNSGYSAQLRGIASTRTAGITINGTYDANFSAHTFTVTVSGRYDLYYDASGGSTYTKDTGWSGNFGKYIATGDFMDAVDTDFDNKVDVVDDAAITATQIKDSVVSLQKMTTAAVNYIGSGGSVTNNPDDVTLENKTGSTLGIKALGVTNAHISSGTIDSSKVNANFKGWVNGRGGFTLGTNKAYTTVDSMIVGGTAPAKIYSKGTVPATEHPRISTGTYSEILSGLNIKFDASGDKDARLNLIQGYSANRTTTPHGSQINFAVQTASDTIKSLFFMGVDYAAPFSDGIYKADSIPPIFIVIGRNTTGSAANDLMSVVGFQYTDEGGATRVTGQWGFNSIPGLSANVFTFSTINGMNSGLRIFGLHKADSDSTNEWIHMSKGSTGITKFKMTSTGEMWWYDEAGGVSPSTGQGSQLKFLDGGSASQVDWWATQFWFESYATNRMIMRKSAYANPTLAIYGNSTVTGRSLSAKDGLEMYSSTSTLNSDISIYHKSSSGVYLSAIDFVQNDPANSGEISFSTRSSGGNGERMRIVDTGHLIISELTTDPTTTQLANGSELAIYNKNNKVVFAMNIGGTITYLMATIDGATTTWTATTTAP